DHALVCLLVEEQFIAPGPAASDVDGGKDALLGEPAVEPELPVAGALELLEDHLIHAAPGVYQAGGDDCQAAPVFDVPRGAEQPLRRVEGDWIDAAGEGPAGLWRRYDEATLAPADRRDEIDDARGEVVDAFLEMHHLVGKDRRELLKVGAALGGLRVETVDGIDAQQAEVLLGVLRLADGAHHVIAGAQGEAADLGLRDVDVADARPHALRAQEAVA